MGALLIVGLIGCMVILFFTMPGSYGRQKLLMIMGAFALVLLAIALLFAKSGALQLL